MLKNRLISVLTLSASMLGGLSTHVWAGDSASTQGMYVKPTITHEAFGTNNVVVPMSTDVSAMQGMKLRNIANGLNATKEWKGQLNVTVVVYSKGITLLQSPDERVRQALDALRAQGVRFVVCNNTLKELDLDYHDLYQVSEKDIVPSGFLEVAYLQAHKHYVVDPAL